MASAFHADLARFGPTAPSSPVNLPEAQRYCGMLARTHYENFTVASCLLPRRLRPHFHAIYAYCRWADDLGDETGGGEHALGLLAWWRQQLLSCYQGQPRHPVMVALRQTIQRYQVPPEPFLHLIQAFEQDQTIKRYESFAQLLDYCRYSANPVGRLVLYLCECFTPENAELADSICTALQLANFWQDVARDLDIGRVYLPREDCLRFGYSEIDLLARRFTAEFQALMQFQVERTAQRFVAGLPLVERVPPDVRLDIELFIQGGQAILRKIAQLGYNVWQQRPALSRWEKGALLAKAFGRRVRIPFVN